MRLYWTDNAIKDLQHIRRYIAANSPKNSIKWVKRLRARAKEALLMPQAGRIVPEFQRDDIREVIEGAYRIVYQVFEDHLVVLTVFEGHRLFPDQGSNLD